MSFTYSVDHSLLSPSGRDSKRARNAAIKRERERFRHALAEDAAQPPAPVLSRMERLTIAASGHPDLASTQAARRILARIAA